MRLKAEFLWVRSAVMLGSGLTLFGACSTNQTQPKPSAIDAQTVMSVLVGEYSNQDQYDALPSAYKIAPEIGSDAPWIDVQFAEFKRVSVPSIPGNVIALQWRRGARDGPISRQRLWAFRPLESGLVMDFYTLTFEISFADDDAFARLKPENLISYGDKCALPVRQDQGAFKLAIPETCQIVSRSGRDITLSAKISIGESLTYQESGRFPNGDLVFQVPGIGPYQFQRLVE